MMGEEAWRDFPSWPPPGYAPTRYSLTSSRGLTTEPVVAAGSHHYRYDPGDPTPAVGGVRMAVSGVGGRHLTGRVDNRSLEARPDVLVYSTEPLPSDVEVVGPVHAEIWFESSLPFADVFVRACDVDGRGRSTNVCDGLVSLQHADALACVRVELWPTAHRFRAGHRIRVQVSSGAFPRFARNPGTGESHATATRMVAADQAVHVGGEHASAIILPVAV